MLVKEVVQTEADYVTALELLDRYFYRPLCEEEAGILTHSETQAIFGLLPTLLACNRALLQRMQERWHCFAFLPWIGDLFIEHSFILKSYAAYVVQYRKVSSPRPSLTILPLLLLPMAGFEPFEHAGTYQARLSQVLRGPPQQG